MRTRSLALGLALIAIVLVAVTNVSAQNAGSSRFGVWNNQSNPNNVMTYESYGDGGMKITVTNTRNGNTSSWGYVTMFDGEFRAVEGQEGSETAVEVINERSTRIINKRNGRVSQIIKNTTYRGEYRYGKRSKKRGRQSLSVQVPAIVGIPEMNVAVSGGGGKLVSVLAENDLYGTRALG